MATIEVDDLVKVYTRGNVRAVDGISLRVDEHEVFGFLGPNGAGKTTAVRIMTTLLRPTSGRVVVHGHDVVADPAGARAAIGVALQDVGLDHLQTGREFLTLQARLYAVADPVGRAAELLDVVGLRDAADRRVGTYSGGMKRRLDLAAALVHRPSVLFLDEPTTGLDPASRNNVWEEVRRLNRAGTTIFLTTQYLEEADTLCGRLAIVDEGRIVEEGTPEALKAAIAEDVVRVTLHDGDRQRAREILVGLAGIVRVDESSEGLDAAVLNGAATVPVLVRELDRAGIDVDEITLRRPTLDDVFLRATGHRLEGAEGAAGPPQDPAAAAGTRNSRRRKRA